MATNNLINTPAIVLGGALTFSGAFTTTFTVTGNTTLTLPTSGTLATTSQIPSVTPAALTKADDTNVTLTLGGTPTTALLQNTSITAGWTGQLSVARGGTGISSFGTGVATALGVNVGSAGAPVTFNGALGTPSSGTLTSATGLPLTTGVSGTLPIANGGTAVTSVTTSPTASSFAGWDANSNLSANSLIEGYATTATAAATTTLTVASKHQQYFTGSTTQTVLLPVTSTLVLGQTFTIVNNSSGVVTVQSSGANTIQAMAANTILLVTCILTSGTTAASWNYQYTSQGLPSASPAGSTTQVQFNNAGAFGASANFTYVTAKDNFVAGGTYSANAAATNSCGFSGNNYLGGSKAFCVGGGGAANGTTGVTSFNYTGTTSSGNYCFAAGQNAYCASANSVAFGASASSNGISSFSLGDSASTNGNYSYCLGRTAISSNAGSMVIGDGNSVAVQTDSASDQFVSTYKGGHFFYYRVTNTPTLSFSLGTAGDVINALGTADQSYSLQVPSTGFSITIAAGVKTLILNPAGTLANGTITMPAAPINGQEIRVTSSQIITSLTVSANAGQSIVGAPTTLAIGLGFAYIYNTSGTTWYRLY